MALILPNPFAWQSNRNNKFLRLDGVKQDGTLKFTEDEPNYVFKTVDARKSGYVNIKLTDNNLFLIGVKSSTCENSTWLIEATDDHENANEDSALFELKKSEPTNDTKVTFRVRHVNSNLYLRPADFEVLRAVNEKPDPYDEDLFTAIGSS